ncbi:hypothetical protein XACM_1280 [Xanthomonas euvesicatoria pv. citrumelo F1]|nr:hypothetical protein XACM_1280 [Xanthomonas euvesicatoria pv. citrumelo F1]
MYASVSRPGKSPPWPPIATSPPATHRPRRGRTLASVKRHACGASDQLAATGRISHVADVVPHWPCLSMTCSRVQRVRSNAIASSSVSVHSGGRVKALKRVLRRRPHLGALPLRLSSHAPHRAGVELPRAVSSPFLPGGSCMRRDNGWSSRPHQRICSKDGLAFL